MTPERWKEIEGLYSTATRLRDEERAVLLAGAAPEVRAVVEAMLARPSGGNPPEMTTWKNETDAAAVSSPRPGTRLGNYQIEAQIGAGGMGVVFRARDTRLGRPVAIKFLFDDLADAPARRRFQREAQTASSLNHPHLVTVHDVGEFEGRQYLVTEFVDGGTLKQWVERQPRSRADIVELLTGVADGLATAHEAGILHRDIKPDNILVASSGYAKLADFGLAKLEDGAVQPADRTAAEAQTRKGTIIGTIAYMSPEQASGQLLDGRSDMFSFGVVLYEMLTGRRPFDAATNLELLQKVIHARPAPPSGDIPEPLRFLVMKALEKEPSHRYPTMRELAAALRSAQHPSQPREPATPKRHMGKWAAAAGAFMVISAGAFFFGSRHAGPTGRLEYTQLTNFTDSATTPTLSADGRMLAFIRGLSTFSGPGDVYVKLLPDGDPVQLTHDGGRKMGPVSFSPDGSRIAYTSGEGTWTVPLLGGEPARLLSGAQGLTWINQSEKPYRVAYSVLTGEGIHMGIFTATESRAEQRTVYLPASVNGMAHRNYPSPDGKSDIVVEMDLGEWLPCRLVPFDGSSLGRRVGPAPAQCTFAGWTPDGEWMYFSANTGDGFHIWRQRFPDGAPEQLTSGATEENGVSFAPDGKSFVTSVGDSQSALWIHDSKSNRQITFEGYSYLPSFSPDGTRLYYLQRSGANGRFVSGELWVADLQSGKKRRLLPDFLMERYSVSPDGRQIVFINAGGNGAGGNGHTLWIGTTDGSSPPKQLVNQECISALFGPDGDVYFVGGEADRTYLQKVAADGSGLQKVRPERVMFLYSISPDGKWLAAWEQARSAVKIYPAGGGDPVLLCESCAGAGAEERGVTPPLVSWSGDGKELYLYSVGNYETYGVPIESGRPAPRIPPTGLKWGEGPPSLAGVRTIPQQRAFMSGNPLVYAYPQLSAHRNIYRIGVPRER